MMEQQGAPQGAPQGGGEAEKIMGYATQAKDNAAQMLQGLGETLPPDSAKGLEMVVQGWDLFTSGFGGGAAQAPQGDMQGGNPNAKPVA